jgi:hypothetical protein
MGATLNQSQILANQIMKNSDYKYSVYGMAPTDFSTLDKMLKLNIIQKPNTLFMKGLREE